jgi:hypothetical protein
VSPPLQAEHPAVEADTALLERRLRTLGLPRGSTVRVHANRTVMVSTNGRGEVRVHRGYAYAPDRVLEAVVRFVSPRTHHRDRVLARRTVVAFPVERYVPSGPRRRGHGPSSPRGRTDVEQLRAAHVELNHRCFDGRLSTIPLRVSNRMTTCLGALSVDRTTGAAQEIVISRRHLEQDPWQCVRDTLLHEMVHQWQVEHGHPADHGSRFKSKARAVGIVPAARMRLQPTTHAVSSSGRM